MTDRRSRPNCSPPTPDLTRRPAVHVRQRRRLAQIERVVESHELESLPLALVDHSLQPDQTLVPPVSEQLGVQRAHRQPTPGHTVPVVSYSRARACNYVCRVLSRACDSQLVVIRLAVVSPRVVVVNRMPVVVPIHTVRGIPLLAPHERHRLPVDRPHDHAGVAHQRAQVLTRAQSEPVGQLHTGAAHARGGEHRLQMVGVRALGQPEPPTPALAEALDVGGDPRPHLHSHPRIGRDQRQHRMCRRRSPAGVPRQRPQDVSPPRPHALRCAFVVLPPRPFQLARQPYVPPRAQARRVLGMGIPARLVDEPPKPLGDPRRAQLIGQYRRHRQRHRRLARVEQVEQRQVATGHRLPQPLLAERPRAEPLDVGHVRMQHDRERTTRLAGRAHRRDTGISPTAGRPRRTRRTRRRNHERQIATKSSALSRSAMPAGRNAKSLARIAGLKRS